MITEDVMHNPKGNRIEIQKYIFEVIGEFTYCAFLLSSQFKKRL